MDFGNCNSSAIVVYFVYSCLGFDCIYQEEIKVIRLFAQ